MIIAVKTVLRLDFQTVLEFYQTDKCQTSLVYRHTHTPAILDCDHLLRSHLATLELVLLDNADAASYSLNLQDEALASLPTTVVARWIWLVA